MIFRRWLLCSFALMFGISVSFAQTVDRKWSISVGGGPQDYRSNLGNGFKIGGRNNSWHGAGIMQVGTFMNPSFDLVFFGSMGDLSVTRLTAVGIVLKYKFANGYVLDESSQLKPYVYFGGAFNNLADKMKTGNQTTDNFLSLNGGLGVRCYLSGRIYIGYNMAIGYFASNRQDLIILDGKDEIYFHNALLLGIDL